MTIPKRIRLGDLLVANQKISSDQLTKALVEQKQTGRKLGRQLVELGFVKEDEILQLLSQQLDIPFIDLAHFNFDQELVQQLPETLARRFRAMLLQEENQIITVALADPTDIFAYDEIAKILNKPIKVVVVRESDLLEALDLAYSRAQDIANLATELGDQLAESEETLDLSNLLGDIAESDAPVVKLLQKIFEDAIQTKASDIHIEPDEDVLRIRQRIDGVLSEKVMNEKRIAAALVVRLKLMAELDIAERRLPQDGRFQLSVKNRTIDVRISTMPVQWGESVVMRLLDQNAGVMDLAKVGMPEQMITRFRYCIQKPHGLVLVTGPTGSGKTTTLYGAINELNIPEKKIITVEDPVEYRLPRINQVQVHEKIGLNFSEVLRSSLRQDPDILLVGEIRDKSSAEIALRASMTGHLVLSTLHTNDAVTSALRLTDIGADSHLVATALKTVIAQRLIRKVCESCAEPAKLTANEQQLIERLGNHFTVKPRFRRGRGCVHCFNTGYRGRIGVFEMLEINRDMAIALRDGDVNKFTQAAHRCEFFRPLSLSAFEYAVSGITSMEEVMRLSAEIEDETVTEIL